MSHWAVAMTKSSSENLAKHQLERQEFRTYLPKFLSKIGKEIKVKILFPRYIFVRIEARWYAINGTRGVTRLIMSESKPAIVHDRVIETLMKREDDNGFISLPEPSKFKLGDEVSVANGPLQGYIGVYAGMSGRERVRILVDLLGRKVPLEMNEADLKARAVACEKTALNKD